jgi:hypothetical protein
MPAKSKPTKKLKAKAKTKLNAKKEPVVKKTKPQKEYLSVDNVLESLVEDKSQLIPDDAIEPDEALLAQQDEEFDDACRCVQAKLRLSFLKILFASICVRSGW